MNESDFAVNVDTLVCLLLTRAIFRKEAAVEAMDAFNKTLNLAYIQKVYAMTACASEDLMLAAQIMGTEELEDVATLADVLWPDLGGKIVGSRKGNAEVSGFETND